MNAEDNQEDDSERSTVRDRPKRRGRGRRAEASIPYAEAAERTIDPKSLAEQAEKDVMREYVDDLEAANRFKSFLLGLGVEVPAEVIDGLARLTDDLITSRAPSPPSSASQAAPASAE